MERSAVRSSSAKVLSAAMYVYSSRPMIVYAISLSTPIEIFLCLLPVYNDMGNDIQTCIDLTCDGKTTRSVPHKIDLNTEDEDRNTRRVHTSAKTKL